jgi:hypothetical protein
MLATVSVWLGAVVVGWLDIRFFRRPREAHEAGIMFALVVGRLGSFAIFDYNILHLRCSVVMTAVEKLEQVSSFEGVGRSADHKCVMLKYTLPLRYAYF